MNKKNIYLLAAIGVVLIALIIQLIVRPAPPSDLSKWNAEEVDRIIITNSEGELDFVWNGTEWRIGPEKYLADDTQMTGLLNRMIKSKVLEKVTESENFARYGLNEENMGKITVISGEKTLQTIYVGQENSTGMFSYIRYPEKKGVYLVSRNLREQIDMTLNDYREKDIANIPSETIKGISVTKGAGYTLVKAVNTAGDDSSDEEVWTLASDSSFDLDQQEATRLANAFNSVMAYEFIDSIQGDPVWEVNVTDESGNSVKFDIYAPDENGRYPATASSSEYKFVLSTYKAEAIMKTLDDLKQTAE